jgi:hypothetical protein
MKRPILTLFLLTAHLYNYAQDSTIHTPIVWRVSNIPNSNSIKYLIDPSIKDSVALYKRDNNNPNYQSMTVGQRKNSKDNDQHEMIAFINYISKDTIVIIIIPKEIPLGGFRINLIGDSAKTFHFIMGTDTEKATSFLRLHQKEKYKNELLVPPRISKLTLTKKPDFKQGEIIEGSIEFESQPYYVKTGSKKARLPDDKVQWYINGYFRTFNPK